jgi:hypothetical protein
MTLDIQSASRYDEVADPANYANCAHSATKAIKAITAHNTHGEKWSQTNACYP